MNADLERLIVLQRLDSAGQSAARRLAEAPERQQAFDARLEAATEKVAGAKQRLAEIQGLRRAVEKDVAMHQGRLSKFRDQAMAVKTNQEYHAIQHEIAFAESEIKALEDRILENMIESDELTAALKRAESELAGEQKAVGADRSALGAELAELQQAMERLQQERGELVKHLDPRVLMIFEKVANRRNGIAVAEAREGICTICHVRLRPQVFNTLRRNEEIIQCDSCNRILYFLPRAAAATDVAPVETGM